MIVLQVLKQLDVNLHELNKQNCVKHDHDEMRDIVKHHKGIPYLLIDIAIARTVKKKW